ncbi:MAG: hypothetical protein IJ242_14440 [Clostridia bacterium]|nr:hypothetical protein [Clostridia bacterium]
MSELFYTIADMMSFLYLTGKQEMAQHFVLVCHTMTTAIATVPKARLCHYFDCPSLCAGLPHNGNCD